MIFFYDTWYIIGPLVSFLGECDPSSWFPTLFNCNCQNFVPNARSVAIFIHYLKCMTFVHLNIHYNSKKLEMLVIFHKEKNPTAFWTISVSLKSISHRIKNNYVKIFPCDILNQMYFHNNVQVNQSQLCAQIQHNLQCCNRYGKNKSYGQFVCVCHQRKWRMGQNKGSKKYDPTE